MKQLYIIGAGGFGREVAWLVESINAERPTWCLEGFIDDSPDMRGAVVGGYPVVGDIQWLKNRSSEVWAVCAIGASRIRHRIAAELEGHPAVRFATIVDPRVRVSSRVTVGEGSIICAGVSPTVDISIGKHVIVNLNCTIGHDSVLQDFATVHPGVNISGTVTVGERAELGTGCHIVQGISIGAGTVIGAGAVVIRDITESGTYVGVPVQKKTSGGGNFPIGLNGQPSEPMGQRRAA